MVAQARNGLARRPNIVRRLREASGVIMCGLGASLALARRSP
jgi:threonine/homoserine/homoserine lactone efflux protein